MLDSTMLFKYPGKHEMHGGRYDYMVVPHDEVDQMKAAGWFLTTTDAKAAYDAKHADDAFKAREAAAAKALEDARALVAKHDAELAAEAEEDNGPVTKAELRARLTELGIEFDGRANVKTLTALLPKD